MRFFVALSRVSLLEWRRKQEIPFFNSPFTRLISSRGLVLTCRSFFDVIMSRAMTESVERPRWCLGHTANSAMRVIWVSFCRIGWEAYGYISGTFRISFLEENFSLSTPLYLLIKNEIGASVQKYVIRIGCIFLRKVCRVLQRSHHLWFIFEIEQFISIMTKLSKTKLSGKMLLYYSCFWLIAYFSLKIRSSLLYQVHFLFSTKLNKSIQKRMSDKCNCETQIALEKQMISLSCYVHRCVI